jgi:glutathionylspermidine synthase
MWKAQEQ